jgi:hypothetical protein
MPIAPSLQIEAPVDAEATGHVAPLPDDTPMQIALERIDVQSQ